MTVHDGITTWARDIVSFAGVSLRVRLAHGSVLTLTEIEIDNYIVKVLTGRLQPFEVVEIN